MKQEITREEDGKIKWSFEKDVEDFTDKEFGKVGSSYNTGYILFDSKEKAISVLDRDLSEVEKFIEQYKGELEKNEHSLDKFTDLKELIEKIGQLHLDFKELNTDKIYGLYNQDPKKYKKLFNEFNNAKDYIKEELSIINKEYQKYINYQTAEKNLKFNQDQYDKIEEQRKKLMEL